MERDEVGPDRSGIMPVATWSPADTDIPPPPGYAVDYEVWSPENTDIPPPPGYAAQPEQQTQVPNVPWPTQRPPSIGEPSPHRYLTPRPDQTFEDSLDEWASKQPAEVLLAHAKQANAEDWPGLRSAYMKRVSAREIAAQNKSAGTIKQAKLQEALDKRAQDALGTMQRYASWMSEQFPVEKRETRRMTEGLALNEEEKAKELYGKFAEEYPEFEKWTSRKEFYDQISAYQDAQRAIDGSGGGVDYAAKAPPGQRKRILAAVGHLASQQRTRSQEGMGIKLLHAVGGGGRKLARTFDVASPDLGGLTDDQKLFRRHIEQAREEADPLLYKEGPWYQKSLKNAVLTAGEILPEYAAAAAASAVLAPEAVPLGAAFVMKPGFFGRAANYAKSAAGTSAVFYPGMSEETTLDLLEVGMAPDDAAMWGRISGGVQAVIEVLELNPFYAAGAGQVKHSLRKAIARSITEFTKRYGREVAEEGGQKFSDIMIQDLGKRLDLPEAEREGFLSAVGQGVKEMWNAAGPLAVLMLPGGAMSLKQAIQTEKDFSRLDALQPKLTAGGTLARGDVKAIKRRWGLDLSGLKSQSDRTAAMKRILEIEEEAEGVTEPATTGDAGGDVEAGGEGAIRGVPVEQEPVVEPGPAEVAAAPIPKPALPPVPPAVAAAEGPEPAAGKREGPEGVETPERMPREVFHRRQQEFKDRIAAIEEQKRSEIAKVTRAKQKFGSTTAEKRIKSLDHQIDAIWRSEFPDLVQEADLELQHIAREAPQAPVAAPEAAQPKSKGRKVKPAVPVAEKPETISPEREAAAFDPDVTGTKNAIVDEMREARGDAPLQPAEKETVEWWMDSARARMAAEPTWTGTLIKELHESGRIPNEIETGGLSVYQRELYNQIGRQESGMLSDDPATAMQAQTNADLATAELRALEPLLRRAGTAWGKTGAARRWMVLDRDYSLASLRLEAMTAKGGEKLTAEENAQIATLVKEVKELEVQLAEAQKQLDAKAAEKPRAKKTGRKAKAKERFDRSIDNLKAKWAALGRVGHAYKSPKRTSRAEVEFVEALIETANAAINVGVSTLTDFLATMATDVGIHVADARDMLTEAWEQAVASAAARTEARKVAAAIKTQDRAIATLEADLKAGRLGPKSRGRKLESPELAAGRARLDALKTQREEMRAADSQYQEDLQTRRDAAYKASLLTRLAGWEQRIADKDFAPKPKTEKTLSKEVTEIQHRIKQAKAKFRKWQQEWKEARFSPIQKAGLIAGRSIQLARAIKSSLDLSGLLRQGLVFTLAHPIRAAKKVPGMLNAFYSKRKAFRSEAELARRPSAQFANQVGLAITSTASGLTPQEEAFRGEWSEHVPLVAGSERAYVTVLNDMRAEWLDILVDNMPDGRATLDQGKVLASFVNAGTGRGNLKRASKAAMTVLFSPRLQISRISLLFGKQMWRDVDGTRKVIAIEHARAAASLGAIYALWTLFGELWPDDDEENKPTVTFNPLSSDFGKPKMGNTRFDILAGFSQYIVLFARLVTGHTANERGVVTSLYGDDKPYGGRDVKDVAADFTRSKFSPIVGLGTNLVTREQYLGEPITPLNTAEQAVMPLVLGDIKESLQEHGFTAKGASALVAILGVGVQTYLMGEIGTFRSEAYRLRAARDEAEKTGITFKEEADYHRAERLLDLTAALRKLGKDTGQEEEVKKYIAGASRWGLRWKDEERYPNPLTAKDLPEDVRQAVEKHLITAAYTTAKPEKLKLLDDEQKAVQAAAQAYLKEVGVDASELADLLGVKLKQKSKSGEKGMGWKAAGQWKRRLKDRLD